VTSWAAGQASSQQLSSPWRKPSGCDDTEQSFRPRNTKRQRLAHISVFSDTQGEFSVFSQAVQSFTTACQDRPSARQMERPISRRRCMITAALSRLSNRLSRAPGTLNDVTALPRSVSRRRAFLRRQRRRGNRDLEGLDGTRRAVVVEAVYSWTLEVPAIESCEREGAGHFPARGARSTRIRLRSG
jgi:hypothetical protein